MCFWPEPHLHLTGADVKRKGFMAEMSGDTLRLIQKSTGEFLGQFRIKGHVVYSIDPV